MVQAIAFAAKDFLICYECGGSLATDRNDVLTDQNPASICPLAFVSEMLSFQLSSVHATHPAIQRYHHRTGRGSWSVAVRVQVRYAMPATETNRLEEEEERRGKTMTRSDRIVELLSHHCKCILLHRNPRVITRPLHHLDRTMLTMLDLGQRS